MVELARTTRGVFATSWGRCRTPPGCIEKGVIRDAATLGSRLRSLLDEIHVRSKRAVTFLPGPSFILREVELPGVRAVEAKRILEWEWQRHVPGHGEMVVDFVIDRKDGTRKVQRGLVVAAGRNVVEGYLETIAQAGLGLSAVEVDSVCCHRALDWMGLFDSNGSVTLVIDLGWRWVRIDVVVNGLPVYSRSVDISPLAIFPEYFEERTLSSTSKGAAGGVYHAFDLAGDVEAADRLASQVVPVISEQVEFYLARKNENAETVILIGGGASFPDICDRFRESLMAYVRRGIRSNARVILGSPEGKFPSITPRLAGVWMGRLGAEYVGALGVALREFGRH